jgi:hypothetical protein
VIDNKNEKESLNDKNMQNVIKLQEQIMKSGDKSPIAKE